MVQKYSFGDRTRSGTILTSCHDGNDAEISGRAAGGGNSGDTPHPVVQPAFRGLDFDDARAGGDQFAAGGRPSGRPLHSRSGSCRSAVLHEPMRTRELGWMSSWRAGGFRRCTGAPWGRSLVSRRKAFWASSAACSGLKRYRGPYHCSSCRLLRPIAMRWTSFGGLMQ